MFGAFYIIYLKCFKSDVLSWHLFIETLLNSKVLNIESILFLITISLFNWCLEIKKWQVLIKSIASISFYEAFKQCTSSLTASLTTPNRIGEYGAKALYYSKSKAKSVVALNLIGNLSQMFWTIIFGAFGLIYLFKNYSFNLPITSNNSIISILISFGFCCIIYWTYKKYNLNLNRLEISNLDVFKILTLSVLRYCVFSFQFYSILSFFSIEISFINAFAFISSIYILASVIPAISLFDVVIKGSIAVFLFEIAGIDSILVLSTVLIMWLLNFAIPAIIGSYFVFSYSSKSVIA